MILIVDDKQENLFALKTLLQLHAYDVDTAGSGEEALKKILKNEYALVILDVQMPGMDGYEVAEAITGYSKTKSLPVIFLSAVNIDKRFITKGYASGGVDYVTKPFDPDLLLLKVKTFQRLYEQNRSLNQAQAALKEEIEVRKAAEKGLQEANQLLEARVRERTKELVEMNKELELSNTELQQYASVASHDLQEPLRKIILFTDMLAEKITSTVPEAGKYIEKVTAASERMRSLINDLLRYSKLSATSHFACCDLNGILEDALSNLELLIREKGAVIHASRLPAIEAIPGQMRQLFQNLISNALKFSKEATPPVINVSCDWLAEKNIAANAAKEGLYVRLCIQDNGIGFDQSHADKIFVLFQRLHGKGQYEGTGIGLAIVKKIVEKHHGLLQVQSREGEGTTFTIVLPATQTPAGPSPTAPE